MIRVIVESPFAPRTPLPDGVCRSASPTCLSVYPRPAEMPARRAPYDRLCDWCWAAVQRSEESTLHARYLAAALRDCVLRGETPYASHGLLTIPGVLRDDVPEERELGIRAGFSWREVAHVTAFYTDLEWSGGMKRGKENALALIEEQEHRQLRHGGRLHRVEERTLGPDWDRK